MASRSSSFLISQNWKRPQESLGPTYFNTFLFYQKKHGVPPPHVQAGSRDQGRVGSVLHGSETPALGRDLGTLGPGRPSSNTCKMGREQGTGFAASSKGEALSGPGDHHKKHLFRPPFGGTHSFPLPRELRAARVSGSTSV